MLKLGFHEMWVRLIMECMSSTTFLVLVNGEPTGYISPTHGLRQGDPLFPYLFLHCAEGLSAILRKAERDKAICEVAICRGGPRMSHLFFFADDSIIFCRAFIPECTLLQDLLCLYEHASGKKVNGDKIGLFFSHNMSPTLRASITRLFGSSQPTQFEKYLGLPPIIGRAKKRFFLWNQR
jgi:hypothetical protein